MQFSFLNPGFVELEVGGKLLKFYPMSIRALPKLHTLIKPFVKAVSGFFATTDNDVEREFKDINDVTSGGSVRHTHVKAADLQVSKYRDEQMEKRISSLVDTILEESNHEQLAVLIIDSLRDEWPDAKPSPSDFLSSMDLAILADLLLGVFEANKVVFSRLTSKLPAGLTEELQSKVAQMKTPKVAEESLTSEVGST